MIFSDRTPPTAFESLPINRDFPCFCIHQHRRHTILRNARSRSSSYATSTTALFSLLSPSVEVTNNTTTLYKIAIFTLVFVLLEAQLFNNRAQDFTGVITLIPLIIYDIQSVTLVLVPIFLRFDLKNLRYLINMIFISGLYSLFRLRPSFSTSQSILPACQHAGNKRKALQLEFSDD